MELICWQPCNGVKLLSQSGALQNSLMLMCAIATSGRKRIMKTSPINCTPIYNFGIWAFCAVHNSWLIENSTRLNKEGFRLKQACQRKLPNMSSNLHRLNKLNPCQCNHNWSKLLSWCLISSRLDPFGPLTFKFPTQTGSRLSREFKKNSPLRQKIGPLGV